MGDLILGHVCHDLMGEEHLTCGSCLPGGGKGEKRSFYSAPDCLHLPELGMEGGLCCPGWASSSLPSWGVRASVPSIPPFSGIWGAPFSHSWELGGLQPHPSLFSWEFGLHSHPFPYSWEFEGLQSHPFPHSWEVKVLHPHPSLPSRAVGGSSPIPAFPGI